MKFYHYQRDFPSITNAEHTELQAFDYVANIMEKGRYQTLVHTRPNYLTFEYNDALFSITIFSHLYYFEISEALRMLGAFHPKYGYFEKLSTLRSPSQHILLYARKMTYTGSLPSSQRADYGDSKESFL